MKKTKYQLRDGAGQVLKTFRSDVRRGAELGLLMQGLQASCSEILPAGTVLVLYEKRLLGWRRRLGAVTRPGLTMNGALADIARSMGLEPPGETKHQGA